MHKVFREGFEWRDNDNDTDIQFLLDISLQIIAE